MSLILPRPSTSPDLYFKKYAAAGLSQGEPGVWYDPGDESTMYQDPYGQTPVTDYFQPVGLIMDARKTEIFRITKADLLNPAKWSGSGGPVASQNSDGSIRITRNTTARYCGFGPRIGSYSLPPGCAVRLKISATANVAGFRFSGEPYVGWRESNPGFLNFGIPSGAVASSNIVGINFTGVSIAPDENSSSRLLGFYMSGSSNGQFSASDYIDVFDFEITAYYPPARQITPTNRPLLREGLQGQNIIRFDGTDDGLSTGILDFSSTNSISWIAALSRRNTNRAMVFEYSPDAGSLNPGSFYMYGLPGESGYEMASAGTTVRYLRAPNNLTPINSQNVVAGQSSISPAKNFMRINGVDVGSDGSGQGSGNYGKHRLFIGRRAGSSFPAAIDLAGLLIRGAATSKLNEFNSEKYLAYRSGVTL